MPGEFARTEQLDFEPNLRQRLDEIRRFLRRNVPAIPPKHVQPVSPVRPVRDVRGDRVGERALRRDQRKGQRRRYEWPGAGAHRAVRRRGAIRRGDFCDECDIEVVWQVLEPAADLELGLAVNVMHVLQAVVLHNCIVCLSGLGDTHVGRKGEGENNARDAKIATAALAAVALARRLGPR